jgi:hypothetical protein
VRAALDKDEFKDERTMAAAESSVRYIRYTAYILYMPWCCREERNENSRDQWASLGEMGEITDTYSPCSSTYTSPTSSIAG